MDLKYYKKLRIVLICYISVLYAIDIIFIGISFKNPSFRTIMTAFVISVAIYYHHVKYKENNRQILKLKDPKKYYNRPKWLGDDNF